MYQHTPYGILLLLLLHPNVAAAAHQCEIDDYAVAYRVQVYESFRHNRQQYQSRLEVGEQALQAYRAQATGQGRQAILDWFSAAIETSRPGRNVPLPALPQIEPAPAHDASHADVESNIPDETAATRSADVVADQENPPPNVTAASAPRDSKSPDDSPPIGDRPPRSLLGRLGQLFTGPVSRAAAAPVLPPRRTATAVRSSRPDTGYAEPSVWESLEYLAEVESHAFEASEVIAEVNESTASGDFTELARTEDPTFDEERAFPGTTETNARIAGHNLALEGLKSRAQLAMSTGDSELPAFVDRLESLVAARHRIQQLMVLSPSNQRDQLIRLAPLDEFVWEFRDQLNQFSTSSSSLSEEQLELLRHRVEVLAEQVSQ